MGTNCSTNCTCMQPNESNMKYLENPHAALTPIGSIDQDSLVTNESIVTTPNSRKVIEMRGNNRRESLEQQKRKHKEHSKHKKEKKREKRNSNGSIKTNASNASNASSSSSSSSHSSGSSNSSNTSSNSNGSNNDNNNNNNNNNNNDINDINSILNNNNNNNNNSSTSPISVISPLSVVSPINHNINNNVILPRITGNINENEEMSMNDSDKKNSGKNVSVPLSARLSSPNNNNSNNNKNRFFGQLRPINSSKQDRIRAQSLGGINDSDLAMVNSVESANMNSISNSKDHHWRGNGNGNGHHGHGHHGHHRPRLGSYTGTHNNYVIKHISTNSSTDLDAQSVGLINKERANSVGLSPKPSLINQRNAQSFNITELIELEAPMKEQLKYLKKREKIYQKMISKTDGLDANTWHA